MESDIEGTIWKVDRQDGTLLWKNVVCGTLQGLDRALASGNIIFVTREDDYGHLRIMTAYGFFWTSYYNLKRAAKKL